MTGLLAVSGCGTNTPTKIAQADQPVIHTVNEAVSLLVAQINAGKLTQKQCDEFKTSYIAYYNAQQVLRAAVEKMNSKLPGSTAQDIIDANNAVWGAEQNLIAFANQFINK